MTVRVRFAPSPTGRLHVGNIYIALANWLFAQRQNGAFVLRLDDTDRERSTAEFAAGIEDDLKWLELEWQERVRQSDRFASYDAAVARLKEAGRLYACYETPEELELKRKSQLQRHLPPVYDRAALKLSDADRRRLEAAGHRPHWRFLLERTDVRWDDLVRGPQHIDEASQSDPVLVRADGTYLYTLPSVVDDIDLAISHVVRGADHVTNTGTQIQLFQALGAEAPRFAHLPLLANISGEGLSKRTGSLSIADLRAGGIEAMAINSYLAHLGTVDRIEPKLRLSDLAEGFALDRYNAATPKFDLAELEHLSARVLHVTPFAVIAGRLAALDLSGVDEQLWNIARANIGRLDDLRAWLDVCRGTIVPVIDDESFAAKAAVLLPPEPWNGGTWSAWTSAVKDATGRKGKELFRPLRLALTGRDHGPEMKDLLPLIGRAKAAARLRGEAG
ncbi:MAG: glutamate--tRNA ligase [Dongiaceae bacterium]